MTLVEDSGFSRDARFDAVVWYLQHPTSRVAHAVPAVCAYCGVENGNESYRRDDFTWPSGYIHLVVQHGVRPPEDLIKAAVRSYRRGVK